MKNIQLKDVMASLRIAAIKDGYEVHNAAGSAKYDVWGYRREVNGIPEYFPDRLSVEGGSISVGNCEIRVKDSSGETRCVMAPIKVEIKIDATDTQKKMDELQNAIEGSKEFAAGMITGINNNFDAIISNAMATQAECERIKVEVKDSARQAVIDAVEAIHKDFETRGPLRRTLGI